MKDVDLGIWSKLSKAVLLLLLAAAVVGVALWYAPVIERNERMRKQILGLEALIQKEEAAGRQLKASIESLSRDPKTLERQVRESLGYAKTGETVFRFETAPNPASTAR